MVTKFDQLYTRREDRPVKDNIKGFIHNVILRPLSELVAWLVPVYGEKLSQKLVHIWLPKDQHEILEAALKCKTCKCEKNISTESESLD